MGAELSLGEQRHLKQWTRRLDRSRVNPLIALCLNFPCCSCRNQWVNAVSIRTEIQLLSSRPVPLAELSALCSDFTLHQHEPNPRSVLTYLSLFRRQAVFFSKLKRGLRGAGDSRSWLQGSEAGHCIITINHQSLCLPQSPYNVSSTSIEPHQGWFRESSAHCGTNRKEGRSQRGARMQRV